MYSEIKNFFKAIRFWQWVKNLVVFTLPVGIGTLDSSLLLKVSISFIGISLISSSNYIINDIRDIDIDRNHHVKRNRPIANGSIGLNIAKLYCIILLFLGLLVLNFLNTATFTFGLVYFIGGIFYTWKFKFVPYIDVVSISFLFLIRVMIGGSSVNIEPSSFLALFIFFSSLCLALSKRISIYQDQNISNTSKYKNFLQSKYNLKTLDSLLKLASFFAILTYSFWVFIAKFEYTMKISSIFLILSIFLLVRVFLGVIRISNTSGIEDFVISIFINKKELFYILISLLFLLVGIYAQ